jgi:hypothetical protein
MPVGLSPKLGMDQIVGHAVPLNVSINGVPVFLMVAEGVEHLCEGYMG